MVEPKRTNIATDNAELSCISREACTAPLKSESSLTLRRESNDKGPCKDIPALIAAPPWHAIPPARTIPWCISTVLPTLALHLSERDSDTYRLPEAERVPSIKPFWLM